MLDLATRIETKQQFESIKMYINRHRFWNYIGRFQLGECSLVGEP